MKEFEKIIGYCDVKMELERVCDMMRNPEKYKRLGVTTPQGILLHGDPGVGKTSMAKCFMEASGRQVFTCRKDKPNGEFVNEIRKVFKKAKEAEPSIVFLDDMDKFANEDDRHRNAEEYVTVQSCIDELKGKEVFVLATANELHCLPDSLLRVGRFDKRIFMESPRGDDATKIVAYYLSKKQCVAEVEAEEIARILNGRSCAELETVINEAGVYAGYAGKEKIELEDIEKACMRVIYNSPEEAYDNENMFVEKIAYHEAGHAVITEILEPDSVNVVSVSSSRRNIGGVTSRKSNEWYAYSKEFMENRVLSALGGKAATEIVYGTVDVGVGRDFRNAFNIVEKFVDDYCSFGFANYELSGCNSNEFLVRKEQAIYTEMERYYGKAKKILIENRRFLDTLVKELVEKKTLFRRDIKRIREEIRA